MQQRDADAGPSSFLIYIVDTYDHGIQAAGLHGLKICGLLGQSHEVSRRAKNVFFFVNMSNGK